MSRILIRTEYVTICGGCSNEYGEVVESESDAIKFIREYPLCSECDGSAES